MEYLFITRHGDFDSQTGNLTTLGKSQIASIAMQIQKYCIDKTVVILTSTAPRALESTKIIAERILIRNIVQEQWLWSGNDAPSFTYYHNQKPASIIEVIEDKKTYQNIDILENDVVILVSHYEVVNQFPSYFFMVRLGQTQSCPKLEKGECIQIDTVNKSFKVLKHIDFSNILMNSKLELLHSCLTISGIPENLSSELSEYLEDFKIFKEAIKDCIDSFEAAYIQALTVLRDKLLN